MRYLKSEFVELAVAVAIALTLPRSLSAQHPADTSGPHPAPPVSQAVVSAGRAIFVGKGGCFVCHGEKLEGVVGPTLRAHEWKDAKGGSLEAILSVILHGVPGTAMVSHPNGISDSSAVRVATYVWAVSHGEAKP